MEIWTYWVRNAIFHLIDKRTDFSSGYRAKKSRIERTKRRKIGKTITIITFGYSATWHELYDARIRIKRFNATSRSVIFSTNGIV